VPRPAFRAVLRTVVADDFGVGRRFHRGV